MTLQKFEVQSAALIAEVEEWPPATLTPAQKRGLKYQARVEKELDRLYSGRIILRPWFWYKQNWKTRKCQPDVILFTEDFSRCSILEIKYSTIPESWIQLSQLYAPVVQKAYRIPVAVVLITRLFDPAVVFPPEANVAEGHIEGLERLDKWNGKGLGVVSWK